MNEECINCLQSTTGYCLIHKQVVKETTMTSSTYPVRKYTKKEVEEKIIYYSKVLCGLKWYQSKKHTIETLKYWVNFLKKWY